jgi:PAS domain S-box-containing protein
MSDGPAPAGDIRRMFEELLEVAPDAILGVSSDGLIVFVNQQAENVFGYSRGELLDGPVERLVPERYHGAHVGHRDGFFAKPGTRPMGANLSLFGRRKDGSEFPAEISLSSIETATGTIAITAVRDITERMAGHRMFEQLLEAAPDAMVGVDRHGSIMLVNQQAERVFGYSRNELLGEPVERLVPKRYHTVHEGHRAGYFTELGTRPMGVSLSLFGLRKDGSEFPAEISLSSIETANGPIAITAVRDIRERMEGQRMFEQLLESAPDAIVGVEDSGSIVIVNQQAERVFGYSRNELLGEPVERLVPERYHHVHEGHRGGFFGDPGTRPMGASLSLFGRRKDGSEFPAEISLSSIETANGLIAITAVRDITERLVAESIVSEEVHRRATMAAMLRAEEAERARIATALHDDTVQVMTASLISIDRICKSLALDSDMRARLVSSRMTIAEATERTRRLSFELRPAVLHEQGLTPAITAMAEQAGREIDASVQVNVPSGRFDWSIEELVYRTVQEAIANLRKHSRAKHVSVTITRRRNALVGMVADDGRGFAIAETTTRADHLLHMGLETMIERVRLSGGELDVDSSPGEGTRISFEIPLGTIAPDPRRGPAWPPRKGAHRASETEPGQQI